MLDGVEDNYKNRSKVKYVGSFKFMASSIDSLIKNLSREQFREMNNVFEGDTDFLIRKGVYPYDYMDILLADLFENLRDVCIKNYKLDPAWY